MREIKFRGQDFDTGEWIYGSYNGVNSGAADVFIIYEKEVFDPVSLGFIDTEIVEKEVKEETVGQYTGLKDKSGVEIYEGDIVVAWNVSGKNNYRTESVRQVRWREMSKYTGFNIGTGPHSPRSIEVIGNIYENPELLQ